MSLFVRVPMNGIRDREILITALRQMGEKVEVGSRILVRGYRGRTREAEIVVRRGAYDIGFRKVGDMYEAIADWEMLRIDREAYLRELNKRYQIEGARMEWEAQGYRVASEHVCPKTGRIRYELVPIRA